MNPLLLIVPGMLFGAGLAISGMCNPEKVHGFLDIAGSWDPSLAFVMGGAVGAFAVFNWFVHRRDRSVLGNPLPGARARGSVDRELLIGAAVFGIGWGLGGVCPGPGLANLSRLEPGMLTFVGTMLVGILLAQRGFGVDA